MTEDNLILLSSVVPGVYMAKCYYQGVEYKAAVSVGWNPVFDNKIKTLEAYLISDSELPDFYDEQL
jgi:FAD synthase